MSIAPLRGRPAPLVLGKRTQVEWPRVRFADLRTARLCTRVRRARNRRRQRIALAAGAVLVVTLAAFWLLESLIG